MHNGNNNNFFLAKIGARDLAISEKIGTEVQRERVEISYPQDERIEYNGEGTAYSVPIPPGTLALHNGDKAVALIKECLSEYIDSCCEKDGRLKSDWFATLTLT